jgi:hypothetical protein
MKSTLSRRSQRYAKMTTVQIPAASSFVIPDMFKPDWNLRQCANVFMAAKNAVLTAIRTDQSEYFCAPR